VGGGCLLQAAGFSFAAAATPAGPDGSQRLVLQLLQRFALRREMPPPRPVLSVSPARSPRGGLHTPEGSSAAAARLRAHPSSPTGGGSPPPPPPLPPPPQRRAAQPPPPASASLGPATAGFPLAVAAAASGFSPADAPDASGISHASPTAGPSRSSSPSSGWGPSRCCWVAPSPGQGASGGRCSAGPAS
jgi:hypothetical protein